MLRFGAGIRGLGDAGNGSQTKIELIAGLTTFLSMAYILVVQPSVISGEVTGSPTGIDAGAAFTVTCLAAACGCLIMAFVARLPLALAPGMGQNIFFVGLVATAAAHQSAASGAATGPEPWRTALGCVFVAGVMMVVVSATGLRRHIIAALDEGLQQATCAGIGLFIAMIGLKQAGLLSINPATGLALGTNLASPDTCVFLAGLAVGAGLLARRKLGAIAAAIGTAMALASSLRLLAPSLPHWITQSDGWTASALATSFQVPTAVVAVPPSPMPLILGLDIPSALEPAMLIPTLALFLSLLFDATGSIMAVTSETKLVPDANSRPFRAALLSDSLASTSGAVLGSSSVTVYVESATGIAAGGRTWLVPCVVAGLFLVALPLAPLVTSLGSYAPSTAASLVIVGALMAAATARVRWQDPVIAIPALLVLLGIPATSSITAGVAMGLVASPLAKLLAGRGCEVLPLGWILAAVMGGYLIYEGR